MIVHDIGRRIPLNVVDIFYVNAAMLLKTKKPTLCTRTTDI